MSWGMMTWEEEEDPGMADADQRDPALSSPPLKEDNSKHLLKLVQNLVER